MPITLPIYTPGVTSSSLVPPTIETSKNQSLANFKVLGFFRFSPVFVRVFVHFFIEKVYEYINHYNVLTKKVPMEALDVNGYILPPVV